DRHDPMLGLARLVLAARQAAERHRSLATMGKVSVFPNGVNAIASLVSGWLDARGEDAGRLRELVAELAELARAEGGTLTEESWTDRTPFDQGLAARLREVLPAAPLLDTGAGHDAGILANAGVPTAMLFVRNPTGISHSPAEHAELADCHAGVQALAAVVSELAG
ncbi:MAG: M20/M25/M40 family metallo-hydrolase, partial [Jatrophihabitantaceae bacterium]